MKFKRLKDLREDHDMYQKEVANLLGISQQYYSEYEKGGPLDKGQKIVDGGLERHVCLWYESKFCGIPCVISRLCSTTALMKDIG